LKIRCIYDWIAVFIHLVISSKQLGSYRS